MATLSGSIKMMGGLSRSAKLVNRNLTKTTATLKKFYKAMEKPVMLNLGAMGRNQAPPSSKSPCAKSPCASSPRVASSGTSSLQLNIGYDTTQVMQTAIAVRAQLSQTIGTIIGSFRMEQLNVAQADLLAMFRSFAQSINHANQQVLLTIQLTNQLRTNVMRPLYLVLDLKRFQDALKEAEKSAQAVELQVSVDSEQISELMGHIRNSLEKSGDITIPQIRIAEALVLSGKVLAVKALAVLALEVQALAVRSLVVQGLTIPKLDLQFPKPSNERIIIDVIPSPNENSNSDTRSSSSTSGKGNSTFGQIKTAFQPVIDTFTKARTDIANSFQPLAIILESARTKIQAAFQPVTDMFKVLHTNVEKAFGAVKNVFETASGKIKEAFNWGAEKFKSLHQNIKTVFDSVLGKISTGLKSAIGPVFAKLAPVGRVIQAAFKPIGAIFKGAGAVLLSSIKPVLTTFGILGKKFASSLSPVLGSVTKFFGNAAVKAGNLLKSSLQNIFNFDQLKSLISTGMKATDQHTNVQAKLNTIKESGETTTQLENKIFASANRTGSNYQQTVDIISDLKLSSPGTFTNNDEVIQFVETAQKAFQLNGLSPADQMASTNVISNVMKKGSMSSEDITEVMSKAPEIATAMANFTGVGKEELQQLAAEGKLTSDIFKNSLLSATREIDLKYKDFPATFSGIGETIKNTIFQTIGPALGTIADKLKAFTETDSFQSFISMIASGFNIIASVGVWAFDLLINNMDIVKNVLAALGIAALIVGVYMLISWLMSIWPILLIVGAIFLIITILNMLGVGTEQVVGFVAGLFMMLFGTIWNAIAFVWNRFLTFAEFLANLFVDPIYAIKKLFYDLSMEFLQSMYDMLVAAETFAGGFMTTILKAINEVIGGVNGLLNGLSKVFGIDIGPIELLDETNPHALSDKVKSLMDSMTAPTSDKDVFSFDDYKMESKNIADMFNIGNEAGTSMFGKGKGAIDELLGGEMFSGGTFGGFGPGNSTGNGGGASGIPDNISNVDRVGEIGGINDTVDISSEDLKMMRELAEMNNIQNFVSLTPSINFGDMHVRQDSDIDIIVAKISNQLNQDIATSVNATYR